MLERFQNGKPVPPQLLRMRAGDLLALTFPAAVACPETMPPGRLPIPMDPSLVRQTIEDCLTESTDVKGLIEVLKGLRNGTIEKIAVDTTEPSAFARGILSSELYTFLDDAPLEERRTQAVLARRTLDARALDSIGMLDPHAVERVREEAFPQPESLEEVHDALLWMGFVTDKEAAGAGVPWLGWLEELGAQRRVRHTDGRWFAVDGATDPKKILLGGPEALGPVFEDDPRINFSSQGGDAARLLPELEHEGVILRTRLEGRTAWCERRLLARIHRYTLDKLRSEIQPVTASQFLQFLAAWQHVDPDYCLEGPLGVATVLRQLAGFEAPAAAWESKILPRRVHGYRREWLDDLTLSGEFAWGRLWGGTTTAIRVTPIAFAAREDLDRWLAMTDPAPTQGLCGPAADLLKPLTAQGAMFPQNLPRAASLVPAHVEMGLAELLARGLVTCDSFAALRQMITPPSRRRAPLRPVGRWTCLRPAAVLAPATDSPVTTPPLSEDQQELIARQLLRRTGVVFRKTVAREKLPITWFSLTRMYRRMELRGEVRGGRFVAGFSGEQYALPDAIELMRHLRRHPARAPVSVGSSDPLNFQGILTPEARVAPTTRQEVLVG